MVLFTATEHRLRHCKWMIETNQERWDCDTKKRKGILGSPDICHRCQLCKLHTQSCVTTHDVHLFRTLICTSDKIYYCKPKILYAAGRLLSSTVFPKVSISLVSEAYAKYLLSKHSAFREHLNWEVSGLPGQQRKGSWHFCWTEGIFPGARVKPRLCTCRQALWH